MKYLLSTLILICVARHVLSETIGLHLIGFVRENNNHLPILEIYDTFTGSGKDTQLTKILNDDASIGVFCNRKPKFAVLATSGYPSTRDQWHLQFKFSGQNLQTYQIGQRRYLAIVNKQNSLDSLSFTQIQYYLTDPNAVWLDYWGEKYKDPKQWKHVKVYVEKNDESNFSGCPQILKEECLSYYVKPVQYCRKNYHQPRKDVIFCDNGQNVIRKVAQDSNGIGFLLYRKELNQELSKVNVLALGKTYQDGCTAPQLNWVVQDDKYPLQEPFYLYLHPQGSQQAKEFCEFAVGFEGAKIAAKFGLITPYAEKQYLAEKYVKMMKSGEGPAVGMTGPISLRELAKGLVLENVKANGPVQLKFSEATESTAINSFLNRDDVYMLLLDSKPSERTMKLVADSWKKVQPVEHIIGGEAMAVIVNPANTVTSLTPDQIRGLFSRQIKDWRFVAAKTAEGNGTARVECFGERLNTPAAQLFIDTVMPSSKIVGVKYRKTAGGVIASVAMDSGGVGFANAAMIDPADKAVRIVPIGLQEKSVLPTEETIINGQYPFSRKLYLFVKPNAPEAVKTIVKFILSPQAVEGFKANGYFPVPQPKPVSETQPVKHQPKKSVTTQPAKPTTQPVVTPPTTQPTTKPVAPAVPTTKPTPKAA